MVKEIEEFGDFAETKLNNHLFNLHKQYNNTGSYTDQKMAEAYNIHRKILSSELEQKLEIIIGGKNVEPILKEGLLAIKRKYESNLIWNK